MLQTPHTNRYNLRPNKTGFGGLCMKGNIITREKCFICKKTLKHDDRRHGLFCLDHPQVAAVKNFTVRFGREIQKQFRSYELAAQFLNGIRFKTSEGSFDVRDYQPDKPFSFLNLSEKYLKRKSSLKSFKEVKRHIKVAQDYFQDRNVKEILGAEIDDYIFSIPGISEKTRANYLSRLSDFWKWMLQRQVITLVQMPIFPKIDYELGYRKITDIETQEAIIQKVFDMTFDLNPKIWLGVDLLATYVNLRPGDLLKLKERDVDLVHGELVFHYPTKKKNKLKKTRLLDHHIDIIKEIKSKYPALPETLFFRHHGGVKSVGPGQPFGPKYLRVNWNNACVKLGVEGLDMYGGTRHTTTTEIARRAGTANARKASAHETNTAFDRYCQFQDDTAFDMAKIVKGKKAKVIKLK